MLKEIKKHLNNIMSRYTNSRQPTRDEVSLTWLVGEVKKEVLLIATKITTKLKAFINKIL